MSIIAIWCILYATCVNGIMAAWLGWLLAIAATFGNGGALGLLSDLLGGDVNL